MTYEDADFDSEADADAVAKILGHYAELSAASSGALPHTSDITYGSHPDQRLDIFVPPGAVSATVIFFHGGWWRSGTKEARGFLATPFVEAGVAFVNVEYPLAPKQPLAAIMESAIAATGWVHRHIAQHGGNARRLILAGNSAGAHLAACAASLEALQSQSVPPGDVIGLVGLSGLYDLSPLRALFPRAWIGFGDEVIERCSPMRRSFAASLAIGLYAGALEPRGFADQTQAFAKTLAARGHDTSTRTSSPAKITCRSSRGFPPWFRPRHSAWRRGNPTRLPRPTLPAAPRHRSHRPNRRCRLP